MQTADCQTAIEQLLTYLEDPDRPRAALDAVIRHIEGCSHCEHGVAHLVQALQTDEEDSLTCEACQVLFPDYFQAEMEGQANQDLWRPLILHLETCPHCSAEYATLTDLTALAYGERGEAPPDIPEPDLSFLGKKQAGDSQPVRIPWRLEELGRLVIQFSSELVQQAFQPPPDPLAYAGAGLKSTQSTGTLGQISLEEVEDLKVTLTAEKMNDPRRCTVTVEVDIPSRGGWPNLANTEVTLKRSDVESETDLTDAYGQVIFDEIAIEELAQLVFEITVGEADAP